MDFFSLSLSLSEQRESGNVAPPHFFACLTRLYKYPPPGQGSVFRGAIKAFIKIKMYVTFSGFPPTLHAAGQLRRARAGVKFPLFSSLTSSLSLIDSDGLFNAPHVFFHRSALTSFFCLLSAVFLGPLSPLPDLCF